MAGPGDGGSKRNATTAVLIGSAVSLLALPSAVLALSTRFDGASQPVVAASNSDQFLPATVDPRLSRSIAVRTLSKGKTFRFTPAGSSARADRSVTVAVRVDAAQARAIRVMAPRIAAVDVPDGTSPLRIAPTAYSLGSTRGYRSFAQNTAAAPTHTGIEIPDLASFRPSAGARTTPSRFSPRIALDEKQNTGRSPRTFDGDANESVDVGGSYRLSRNLNVTAGVRYQTERDRLVPLTDGRQDSQAVYVGTQFRF